MRGTAEFVNDPALMRRVIVPAITKYYASPGAITSTLRHAGRLPSLMRYRRERKAVGFIRVSPMSWQFIDVPKGEPQT
jgi:hypothetical protein